MSTETMKDILYYLLSPEDTTEAGRGLAQGRALAMRQWLGPLKTALWTAVAVIGPLLLCSL